MEQRQLGKLWPVSALALGGGGLGQIWGETSRSEAVNTVREAIDQGITMLDMAPSYGKGEAEVVIGEAFNGKFPNGIRVTTKCLAGMLSPEAMYEKMERSIVRSLNTMKREQIDLFFLHSQILPVGYQLEGHQETQHLWTVDWNCYEESVLPAMQKLVEKGLVANWGITGVGVPSQILKALQHAIKPAAVQVISNLLDSPGGIRRYHQPPEPRNIIKQAKANDVGVIGIRAVQAGALTAKFDRELSAEDLDMQDYTRAEPWRKLCSELQENPAVLAHRYALAMEGVDTVVLGVKNTTELREIVDGINKGALSTEIISKIDSLGLRK